MEAPRCYTCPLCEAPIIDHSPKATAEYDGLEYHASCLYEEMPELNPDREPTSAEEDAWSMLDIEHGASYRQSQAQAVK